MYPKCSLSDSNIYLQIVGLLSLVIIIIIAGFYYIRVCHSSITEKYEQAVIHKTEGQLETGDRSTFPKDKYPGARLDLIGTNTPPTTTDKYELRDCKVYFTDRIKECDDINDDIPTKTCSYKFDGWQEFATYTDKNNSNIYYPKKIYKKNASNTEELINSYFTSKCFKEFTNAGKGSANNFEYTENNVVKYDSKGNTGNTESDTNILGGKKYTSIQFLNGNNSSDNLSKILESICSIKYNTIPSLAGKKFYKFVFIGNDSTRKIQSIETVILNSEQNGFDNAPTNTALTDLQSASSYGIQYDSTNTANPIRLFKKTNNTRNINVYKFNYVSYFCPTSQIKDSTIITTEITPSKLVTYGQGSGDTNKNININGNNITICDSNWDCSSSFNWNNYSSTDLNRDFRADIDRDLKALKIKREKAITESSTNNKSIADADAAYNTATTNLDNAYNIRDTFSSKYSNLYITGNTSLIGLQNPNNSSDKKFNYNAGYNIDNNPIQSINIQLFPTGATLYDINGSNDKFMRFTHTGGFNSFTNYTINIPQEISFDLFMIGGGGAGGGIGGSGGGSGSCLVAFNQTLPAGNYIFRVGGAGSYNGTSSGNSGYNTIIANENHTKELYLARGGGGGAADAVNGIVGGCSGGAAGGINNVAYTSPTPATDNIFNNKNIGVGINNSLQYGVYGNKGGNVSGTTDWNTINYGGGGGIGSAAADANPGYRSTPGGNGLHQVVINGITYNLRDHFANGTNFGDQHGYIGGGGGGGGFNGGFGSGLSNISGGKGGGGTGKHAGYPANGTDGAPNTGSGGGGGSTGWMGNSYGGNGGSGLLIIRFKLNNNNNNIKAPYLDLPTNENFALSVAPNSLITLSALKIETKILSSYIFLQKGYYIFSADIGGDAHKSKIIYSELTIFDESNLNGYNYNTRIVFRSENNNYMYFNKYINIPKGKFYKLVYRYTSRNNSNSDINLLFNINCNYQSTISNPGSSVKLNDPINTIQYENNITNSYSNIANIRTNLVLTNYLFGGTILKNDYNETAIMNLFEDVQYVGNTYFNYQRIILFLDSISFFNIRDLERIKNDKYKIRYTDLPSRINSDVDRDTYIIKIQTIIDSIANISYSSHFNISNPQVDTTKKITDIFGTGYEKLLTFDKVSSYDNINDNSISQPLNSSIYMEALK
jgi:hypothetical protein